MNQIILGDCLYILKLLGDNSVDSIVTDPPAGISFMGKSWDSDKGGRDSWISWMTSVAVECKRVLKPGGHASRFFKSIIYQAKASKSERNKGCEGLYILKENVSDDIKQEIYKHLNTSGVNAIL